MSTLVGVIAIIVILALSIRYIYKEKKKGRKCIGCPFSEEGCCSNHCDCSNDNS